MGPDSQWIHLCALFQNMKQTVLLIIYSLAFIAKDLISSLFFFFLVNPDLDFLKEYCLLFPLSSLRHSMYRAIYVVAP